MTTKAERRVEVVGERVAEGFDVVAHVRRAGLVGRQFLERLTDAQCVLGAGRKAGERVAEWQRVVGAEQVERDRRVAEVFERVAQQNALAGGARLGLDAVAAGAKADVDPAVDVRARNLEQAHLGVVSAQQPSSSPGESDAARGILLRKLVEHVAAAGRVEQELGGEAFALQEALEEAEQHERPGGRDVNPAVDDDRRGAHLDSDRVPRADWHELPLSESYRRISRTGVRLHLARHLATKKSRDCQ